jgi:hypothetical protein
VGAFSEALSNLCRIEHVTLNDVKAITVDDDEVTLRIVIPHGRSRISVYPARYLFPNCSLGRVPAADDSALPPTRVGP